MKGPVGAARRSMHLGRGRAGVAGGWIRLVLEVDDIQARVASIKKAGLPFRNEIVTGPGGRQVPVEDPSGNPIEIFQAA